MTAALERRMQLALPPRYPHAARAVARAVAYISRADGSLRWGISTRRLAELTGYAPSTVKVAKARLVADGWLVVEQLGGGRTSTRYGLGVDKLLTAPGAPATTTPEPGQQQAQDRPPQGDRQGVTSGATPRVRHEHPDPRFRRQNDSANRPLGSYAVEQRQHAGPPCDHGEPRGAARCALCRRTAATGTLRPPVSVDALAVGRLAAG